MHITSSTCYPSSSLASSVSTTQSLTDIHIDSHRDEHIYRQVFKEISDRYTAFNQANESGYLQQPGITDDIRDLSVKDTISILNHIRSTPSLLEECQKNSANSSLFTKLYLMSEETQGWNLRLHIFSVKGSGLGGEDSPHFHRWTLASKVLSGGYINVNYKEGGIDQPHSEADEYSKY